MRLAIFLTTLLAVSGLVAAYITWRLFGSVRIHRLWKFAIAAGIVGIFFMMPINITFRRAGVANIGVDILVWTGYLGIGFVSTLFTILVLRDVVWIIVSVFKSINVHTGRSKMERSPTVVPQNPGRRGFLISSVNYGVWATASIFTGYGIVQAKKIPDVKEVLIPIAGLPSDFHGYRIVQITDIHVSPTIRRPFVEEVVEVVNSLAPDIVAHTGDLVDGSVDRLAYHVAPLERLVATDGNFFVTGNHEYYSGAVEWVEKVKRLGFTVLLNENRIITRGRSRLLLAGVTDYRGGRFIKSHRSDPLKAMSGAPSTDVKILLAHRPKSIYDAARAGYDLQISGHTHGGQLFPWTVVADLYHPFAAGHHRYKNTQIYISRGTGYWGPPLRVASPSEITLIKLVPL